MHAGSHQWVKRRGLGCPQPTPTNTQLFRHCTHASTECPTPAATPIHRHCAPHHASCIGQPACALPSSSSVPLPPNPTLPPVAPCQPPSCHATLCPSSCLQLPACLSQSLHLAQLRLPALPCSCLWFTAAKSPTNLQPLPTARCPLPRPAACSLPHCLLSLPALTPPGARQCRARRHAAPAAHLIHSNSRGQPGAA